MDAIDRRLNRFERKFTVNHKMAFDGVIELMASPESEMLTIRHLQGYYLFNSYTDLIVSEMLEKCINRTPTRFQSETISLFAGISTSDSPHSSHWTFT